MSVLCFAKRSKAKQNKRGQKEKLMSTTLNYQKTKMIAPSEKFPPHF
jgi:hypothetical protein